MLVRDLGSMAVEVDGVDVALGRKPAAILALLTISQGRRVASETLVDALWGDDPSSGTMSTLESHVWRLRQQLEPQRGPREAPRLLLHDAGGYRLLVSADQIDSAQLERLVDDARGQLAAGAAGSVLELVDAALQLWRGRPYSPFSDEQWAMAAVARLEETLRQAHELRLDALLALGRTAEALVGSELLVRESGYQEHPRAQQILALHRAGRTDDALRTFQEFRQQLLEDLGLEPSAELVALQRRILTQDPTLLAPAEPTAGVTEASVGTVHLPGRRSALIGRDVELREIASLVTTGSAVTVTGAAGCGKTRLAIEVARDVAPRFPEGVWFVDLTAVDTATQAPDVVAATLGFGPGMTGEPLEALAAYLYRRRILLVLDNCEHLLPDLTPVVETLLGSADCWSSVLATSRQALELDGEVVWSLRPLALPDADGGTRGLPSAAVELFLARAAGADPSVARDEEDLPTVEAICVDLDGLPLAIELAAARLRAFSLDEVAEHVARNPVTLSRLGSPGVGDHHRSVGTAIAWSVQLLSPTERRVHEALSVLPGRFTVRAARAVTAGSPVVAPLADDVDDVLPMLVNRSLLASERPRHRGGRSSFWQLETVRAHAADLVGGDATDDLLDRRDAWVLDQLASLPRIGRPETGVRYREVEDDYPTVRAALHRTLAVRRDATTAGCAAGLLAYWYFRQELPEGSRWLALGAELASQPSTPIGARVLSRAAYAFALLFQGRPDLAYGHVEEVSTLLPGLDETELLAAGDLLPPLAVYAAVADEPAVAVSICVGAAAIAGRTADAHHQVHVSAARCMIAALRPDPSPELDVAAEARDVYARARAAEHLLAAWQSSNALALAALRTGRPDQGVVWARRSAALSLQLGDRRGGPWLELLADLLTMGGKHERAWQVFSAAQAASSRAGSRFPRLPISRDLFASARTTLDRGAMDRAWRAGRLLTLEQIADEVDLDP